MIEDLTEAPFEIFAALAEKGLAAFAFDGSLCLGGNLTNKSILLVRPTFGGVKVTDEAVDPLALQATGLLDTEAVFVGGEAC